MDGPIWLQVSSLVVVLLALGVSTYQVWLARNQTAALRRTTETALTAGQAEARHQILYNDPELMAWHLRNRNCEGSSAAENRRRYFIIQKHISNETLYVGHLRGHISDETWKTWVRTVSADILVKESVAIWPQTKFLYSAEYQKFAEGVLRENGHMIEQSADDPLRPIENERGPGEEESDS